MKGILTRIFKKKEDEEFQDISVYNKHSLLVAKRRKLFSKVFFIVLVVVALLLMAFCVFAFFDTNAPNNRENSMEWGVEL